MTAAARRRARRAPNWRLIVILAANAAAWALAAQAVFAAS